MNKSDLRYHHPVTVSFKESKDETDHGVVDVSFYNFIFNANGYITTGRAVPLAKLPRYFMSRF